MLVDELKVAYHLSDEAAQLILDNMEEVSFNKGEVIVGVGQRNHYFYFIYSGIVKTWFVRNNRERVLDICFEGDLITMPTKERKTSTVTVQALEDTIMMKIEEGKFEKLIQQSPELALWAYRQLRNIIDSADDYYMNLAWMDKQHQYEEILTKHPKLVQKIPLKDLASYLNITQSSLSRIRASIK